MRSIPAKIFRRLCRLADDFETGRPARWRRHAPDCFQTIQVLHRLLPEDQCRVVYDVGAARGNWIGALHAFYPKLRHAVLFEPAAASLEILHKLKMPGVVLDICPCALGARSGCAQLIGDGPSASLLPADTLQETFFPGSSQGGRHEVLLSTLDAEVARLRLPAPDVLKIDVQGLELSVLQGAHDVLQKCRWMAIELSTVCLYDGQNTAPEILEWLDERGWRLAEIGYRWVSSAGRLLQFDAILTTEPPQ